MSKCILCQTTVLDHSTKPEHILGDALGGRKKTRRAICSTCNGTLGSTVDKVLAEQVEPIRSMFSMRSGNGQLAPTIRVTSGDITFDVIGDGRLRLVTPRPFESTLSPDGTFSLQITARSEEDIARSFANAAAKLNMSVDELVAKTKSVSGSVEDQIPGFVGHSVSLGGPDVGRSMMKSALVLWCTSVGNAELQKPCYDQARRFVLCGEIESQITLTAMDERYVEGHTALTEGFGPLFNYIAVVSDARGKVKAYFSLYGLYALCMTLATAGGVAGEKAVLVSNPLDPVHWSDDSETHIFLDAAWIDNPQQSQDLSTQREKYERMGAFHEQFSRDRMIKIAVEDIWRQKFPDLTEIDAENAMPLIAELSHAISHNLGGVSRSKPFTFDDLMEIVRGTLNSSKRNKPHRS